MEGSVDVFDGGGAKEFGVNVSHVLFKLIGRVTGVGGGNDIS